MKASAFVETTLFITQTHMHTQLVCVWGGGLANLVMRCEPVGSTNMRSTRHCASRFFGTGRISTARHEARAGVRRQNTTSKSAISRASGGGGGGAPEKKASHAHM